MKLMNDSQCDIEVIFGAMSNNIFNNQGEKKNSKLIE